MRRSASRLRPRAPDPSFDATSLSSPPLQRVAAGLAGADADGLLDRHHEDLAVADLAGGGGLLDRLDRRFDLRIGDDDLDLDLGQEAHRILRTAVDLGLPLLATESLHLA